ncbi:hypothetical protein EYF80_001631 [Liparis tanakae]|uniref:Uncharacterized protein n=1 Tax=Liparis tanakae TaxID=230148 RepID=A0A4Z2JD03_9TELE|nr:hypothetical protein EYF80_001631 [Liparis tanakae]
MNARHAGNAPLSVESPRTGQSQWALVPGFAGVSGGAVVSGVAPNALLRREEAMRRGGLPQGKGKRRMSIDDKKTAMEHRYKNECRCRTEEENRSPLAVF